MLIHGHVYLGSIRQRLMKNRLLGKKRLNRTRSIPIVLVVQKRPTLNGSGIIIITKLSITIMVLTVKRALIGGLKNVVAKSFFLIANSLKGGLSHV